MTDAAEIHARPPVGKRFPMEGREWLLRMVEKATRTRFPRIMGLFGQLFLMVRADGVAAAVTHFISFEMGSLIGAL